MGENAAVEDAPGSAGQPQSTLVGRRVECAALDELLARVRRGSGRFLCLEGDAGIGKTALLGWAMSAAADFRILRSRPVPDADGRAYSAVSELLAPLHGRNETLSDPNGLILNQLFGELRSDRVASPVAFVDPLTIGAALLGYFEKLSRPEPLLVLIDDAHWMDISSALALTLVARRVEELPVAMLVATRPEGASRWRADGLDGIEIRGLSVQAAEQLLHGKTATAVARRLADASHGNPLALLAVCDVLTDGQRWEREPIEEFPNTDTPSRVFGGRLAGIDTDARLAVAVVAYDDRLDRRVVAAICEGLGARNGEQSVAEAERQGLLQPDQQRLVLVHPLLRSEVDVFLEPGLVRAVHGAIADALRRDNDLERRAWHLARSVEGPDEPAAELLFYAGQRALSRGDPSAAALSFLRSGELTPGVDDKSDRLGAAGDAFAVAGQAREAVAAFDLALSSTTDPSVRGGLLLRRLMPLNDFGAERVVDEMHDAITATERANRPLAGSLAAYSAMSALALGALSNAADFLARASEFADELDAPTGLVVRLIEALVSTLRGDPASAAPTFLEMGAMPGIEETPIGVHVAIALYWADAFAPAEELINAVIAMWRSRRAPGAYMHPLIVRAEVHWRTGRFAAARADAAEARMLATSAGRSILAGYAASMLARAEASLGRVDEARALSREAVNSGGFVERLWAPADLGFIELTGDAPAAAIPHLERAAEFADHEQLRLLSAAPWGPDLVEAYVRVGRSSDARALVGRLTTDAGPTPNLWSRGALARCAGLVEDDFVPHFEEALIMQDQLPIRFEVARTRLCYGERLERSGWRVEGAAQLQVAHEVFTELGAECWARRAERELVSSGHAVEPSRPPALAALTSKEYQVAALVAQGLTNREAANSLFLSTRTVEAHLASAYRKLGIKSRTQLLRELSRSATTDVAPG